ncbi:hypothetical protein Tco_0217138 [Tanacetum coccineum]
MTNSNSSSRSPKQRALYHALIESILKDEDAMDEGVADKLKKRKPYDVDKDEGPSTGSDRGLKRRKTSKDTKPSKKAKSTETSKGTSKSQLKSIEKSAQAEEKVFETGDTQGPHNQRQDMGNTDDQPKVKAALKHDWIKKPERPPTPNSDWNCYKAITDRLDWNNPEGKEYPFDLSKPLPLIMERDMLLLLVQKKLSNLERDVILDLGVALWMFTIRIVILRRVEVLQLGVESYKKKLNITKPETFKSDISNKTPYTAYNNPQGIIYEDKYKRNRLMHTDELYKFNDGTLTSVRSVLHDIALNLRMDYLPRRRWSGLYRKKSRIMIKAIDKQLYNNSAFSSL